MYDRSLHEASCPCKLCIGYDVQFAVQEGHLDPIHWKPGGLEHVLSLHRNRKLNWNLPVGHCLVCGGTKLWAYTVAEHYQIVRYNEVELDGKFYTSLLLHKEGSRIAVYNEYVRKQNITKSRLIEWASNNLDLLPEKCIGIASREHPDWIELRLAFTELVEDSSDKRIERYWAASGGRGSTANREVGSISSSPTEQAGTV